MSIVWVALFGLAGIFTRYGTDLAFQKLGGNFPVGTFLINVLGSFLAGVVYAWAVERGGLSPELRTGILVGFLGGFTTFSAFSLQTARLLESGAATPALLYATLSPLLGIGAAWGGLALSRSLG